MIAVTERAKKALLTKKVDAGVGELDIGLRLTSATDGTLILVLDRARAGDHVVTYRDSIVLLADGATAALVSPDRIVDCRRTGEDRVEIVLTNRQLGDRAGPSEEPRSASGSTTSSSSAAASRARV